MARTGTSLRATMPAGASSSCRHSTISGVRRSMPWSSAWSTRKLAIAVDHQARQAVGFPVDQAVGVGVRNQAPAEIGEQLRLCVGQESIHRLDAAAQQPQRDLGRGTVVGGPQGTRPRVNHGDGVAGGGGAAVDNVTRRKSRDGRWSTRAAAFWFTLTMGRSVTPVAAAGRSAARWKGAWRTAASCSAAERFDDEHVGGGRGGVHGNALGVDLQLLQCADQTVGAAGDARRRGVAPSTRACAKSPSE